MGKKLRTAEAHFDFTGPYKKKCNSYAALDEIYDADVDNDDSFLALSKQNLTPLPGEKRHPRS